MDWFDIMEFLHLIACGGVGHGIEDVEAELRGLRCPRAPLILSLKRQEGQEEVLGNHGGGV